ASNSLKEVRVLIEELEHSLQDWHSRYPDTSPIRIDNESAFLDPGKNYLIPTLIAYSLALSQQLFAGASELSTNVTLQILHLYGTAIAALGGQPNFLQTRAIDTIPSQIGTVENRFNFGIETVIYAVCPCCNYPYDPQSSPTSTNATYPTVCTNRSPPSSPPCNTPLLDQTGSPLKAYEYYPFPQWFAQFVAQLEIQQYAKAFCNEVQNNPIAPADKVHTWDGDIYRVLLGPDGKLFTDGGDEGHFLWLLHVDFFNSEGSTGRGKDRSTGLTSIRCVNLPYHLREDINNVYIPGFWRGPKEPSAVNAQLAPLLKPVISDFEKAYTHRIRCHGSPQSTNPTVLGNQCTFRSMIAGACLDLKAARPVSGLLNVTSHHICSTCNIFHKDSLLRTDYENWSPANDKFLWEGMQKWREAQTDKEREIIENYYGTRCSAMEILEYFKFSLQVISDPMHAFYHCIIHTYFRNALHLTTLSPNIPSPYPSNIAFYYDFSHPPRPNPIEISRACTSQEYLAYLEWHDLTGDDNQIRCDIVKGHQLLSQRRPTTSSERKKLLKKLNEIHWHLLLYICNDLWISPASDIIGKTEILKTEVTRKAMAESLLDWRRTKPVDSLLWPQIHSGEVLSRVHRCIREVLVPSWVAKPPFDTGLKSGGTLKANDWRLLITLYLPLALLSLWKEESPIRADNFANMQSILDNSMHLSCASLLMAKETVSLERRQSFLWHYKAHVGGLKEIFPGFGVPSHHIGFHVYDFIRLFGPVRNFWCFPGERLIGKLQKVPVNHRPGQSEITLLHSYAKGVGFHQWLLCPDCPPLLKQCYDLLNKAYHFSSDENPGANYFKKEEISSRPCSIT
ncbi:hypothetical protein GYMLUDRAFT_179976, partial [Collybiopsis luxurians FD-317 M1]